MYTIIFVNPFKLAGFILFTFGLFYEPTMAKVQKIEDDERIILKTISDHVSIPAEAARKLLKGVLEPRKQAFLLAYCQLGSRSRAARAVSLSPTMTWVWRHEDDQFAAAYMRAQEIASELMEDEMFRRASEGVLEPVWQGGRLVGSIRRYSDTLLIFGLKGAMPDKYRENVKHEHSGEIDVVARLRAGRQRRLKSGE